MTRKQRRVFLWSIVVGVILRLLIGAAPMGNFDLGSYKIVAEIMRNGGNVYAETSRYNYSPVWFHLLHSFDSMKAAFGIDFHVALRLFLTVVDVVNALLVGAIANQLQRGTRAQAVALYMLNPGGIALVAYHSQFELLAVAPLLVAVLVVLRNRQPRYQT